MATHSLLFNCKIYHRGHINFIASHTLTQTQANTDTDTYNTDNWDWRMNDNHIYVILFSSSLIWDKNGSAQLSACSTRAICVCLYIPQNNNNNNKCRQTRQVDKKPNDDISAEIFNVAHQKSSQKCIINRFWLCVKNLKFITSQQA